MGETLVMSAKERVRAVEWGHSSWRHLNSQSAVAYAVSRGIADKALGGSSTEGLGPQRSIARLAPTGKR